MLDCADKFNIGISIAIAHAPPYQTKGIYMKKPVLILLSIFSATVLISKAEPRGWGIGLGSFDGDFGAQARKDFNFGSDLQYGVALQGGLYNQDKVTGRFDADFHYIFYPRESIQLYPLAGLDWAIQSKNNRFGANLGGGCVFNLNELTRIFIEAKYVASDWDGFAFTAGIYF